MACAGVGQRVCRQTRPPDSGCRGVLCNERRFQLRRPHATQGRLHLFGKRCGWRSGSFSINPPAGSNGAFSCSKSPAGFWRCVHSPPCWGNPPAAQPSVVSRLAAAREAGRAPGRVITGTPIHSSSHADRPTLTGKLSSAISISWARTASRLGSCGKQLQTVAANAALGKLGAQRHMQRAVAGVQAGQFQAQRESATACRTLCPQRNHFAIQLRGWQARKGHMA